MGYEVHVIVTLPKPPGEALMTALDHQFEVASHTVGTKTVILAEHVSIDDEQDAIGFVRSLVEDAIPDGAKITEINATAD